jgi:hypothetical protein
MKLLRDVESHFRQPVVCKIVGRLATEEGGRANETVTADGTPLISLDAELGTTETEIAHELFHLQLKEKGFQQGFSIEVPPDVSRASLGVAVTSLSSLIEHRLFYPQMRKMGFDPSENYRKEVEEHIERDQPPPSVGNHPELLAVDYAIVALTSNDQALTKRVRAWYRKHGWLAQLKKGEELVRYLAALDPNTPEKKKVALAACLRIVYDQEITIS